MKMEFRWEYLWIMIMVIILLTGFNEVHGCWEQERAALLHLKAYFNYPPNLEFWVEDKTSDCCRWPAVECDMDGHIFSLLLTDCWVQPDPCHFNASLLLPFEHLLQLDLSGNNIATCTQLTGLRKLEALDLSQNHLDSSILPQLNGLISLKHLKLHHNWLTGLIQLHDIEAMKNLEELDLSYNTISAFADYDGCGQMQKLRIVNLNDNRLETLPSCFCHLTSLHELHLFLNQLGGDIPSCLQNLKDLQTVDLSYNQISGDIPSWFQSWTALRVLNLTANQFKGNVASSPLTHLLNLEALELSQNHFQISHSFKPLANLTKLKIFRGNDLQVTFDKSESDAQPFFPRFQLQELDMSDCALTAYPPFFHQQHDLREITLARNFLTGDFPVWLLENNPQLNMIVMMNNNLTGALHLPSSPHAYISYIDVTQNKIQGHIPENIGVVFPWLEDLLLRNNEIKGNIPLSLCDLKSLSKLVLSNNQLSGGIVHLGSLNLSFLDLSNNHLEGKLPSFYEMSSLVSLNLEGNNFSGSISSNLFNPNLRTLVLGSNSLQGPIPEDLCTLYSFTILNLSHNKLNGSVPSSCLHSHSLWVYLNDNKLSGHLSNAFYNTSYSYTETLDLSNNDLMGHIPPWIGNITSLRALLLRGNQFQGEIPVQLCKLLGLSILDLSYNNLSGPIPPCFSKLNFSASNGFSPIKLIEGSVEVMTGDEVAFRTKSQSYSYSGNILRYMSGIDLSCNKFTGEIPAELGNMGNLHALNLSHNKLWGGIPTTLSNLKAIESLDLSYNSLNGSIPVQLAKLDPLEVFKVAYNNLSGRIPFEGHFSTFDASSYQGNPFLCGPPLSTNCTQDHFLPSSDGNSKEGVDDYQGWIDMETFYMSFGASFITMFLGVVVIFWINPHWRRACFYLAKTFVISSYYFIQDKAKFRRIRTI